jgi:hypothetical protein
MRYFLEVVAVDGSPAREVDLVTGVTTCQLYPQ